MSRVTSWWNDSLISLIVTTFILYLYVVSYHCFVLLVWFSVRHPQYVMFLQYLTITDSHWTNGNIINTHLRAPLPNKVSIVPPGSPYSQDGGEYNKNWGLVLSLVLNKWKEDDDIEPKPFSYKWLHWECGGHLTFIKSRWSNPPVMSKSSHYLPRQQQEFYHSASVMMSFPPPYLTCFQSNWACSITPF